MRRFPILCILGVAVAAAAQGPIGPTVGDPIAVDLEIDAGEHVAMEPVDGIEIVGERAGGVIVRGFRPGTFPLRFVLTDPSGSTREVVREVEIASVLHPDDDLVPAPLAPPIPSPPNRTAWVAIGLVTIGAAAVWLHLLWMPRKKAAPEVALLSPADELRRVIERVRRMAPSDERFATLSDATRRFLWRIDPRFGRELTSTELIERLGGRFPDWLVNDVRDILDEGDYAKFSPWGGRGSRFDQIVEEANSLPVLDREGGR